MLFQKAYGYKNVISEHSSGMVVWLENRDAGYYVAFAG